MRTLVVGRGLLGSHLERRLQAMDHPVETVRVPWAETDAAVDTLVDVASDLARRDADWRLAWCAGAGFTSASAATLDAEVDLFTRTLGVLAEVGAAPASLSLASSAGGVYAGSSARAPFDEDSPVGTSSAYGAAKLAMEEVARALAATSGTRVLIARIANLYGPGQDLDKPQGLVSQLCLSQVVRRPLGIYVPLDTLRDYVYAPDAAAVLAAALDRVHREESATVVTKIVASGRAASIAELISVSTQVFRSRPWLQLRAGASSVGQVGDLRLRSRIWPDLDVLAGTPLPTGLRRTADDVAARHRAGELVQRVSA